MQTLLFHEITPDQFFEKIRIVIREEIKKDLQKDELLTKEGAMKMMGISSAVFMKAINDGIVKSQLVKGRKKAMYLESEVLKIEKKKRSTYN